MPELLYTADSGRRDRQVVASPAAPATLPHVVSAPRDPLLLCQRVSKWYGAVMGVNQVTLELRSGITGLVGSNGAGKSTLMRLITGQIRPDLGSVTIRGIDAWSSDARWQVGYCPDADAFYEEMSGRQFVESMAKLCGFPGHEVRRRTEAVLERVGMSDRANRRLRGYSKGMRQRIKLAQALIHDPPLLVLDEPLSGIDPVGRAEMVTLFQALAAQGKCLLISSHELDELEKLTDHVAIMSHGRIAAVDTVSRIRERLADQPMTIRLDLRMTGRRKRADHRELAGLLVSGVSEVVGVEVVPTDDKRPELGRLLVRARHPTRFFPELNRLILDEGYDVMHLETLDSSTQAVLGYLLGSRG